MLTKFTPFLWGPNGSRCEGGREGDLPWREINRTYARRRAIVFDPIPPYELRSSWFDLRFV